MPGEGDKKQIICLQSCSEIEIVCSHFEIKTKEKYIDSAQHQPAISIIILNCRISIFVSRGIDPVPITTVEPLNK